MDLHNILNTYYSNIDAGDTMAALSIFSDDCEYQRGTVVYLKGIDQLIDFYVEKRQIVSGKHFDLVFSRSENIVKVRGRFRGILKKLDEVEVIFEDGFSFNEDGKVVHRYTEFLDQSKEI